MWAYIFGAICSKKGKGTGLVLPYCDTEAMQTHLGEISQAVNLRRVDIHLMARCVARRKMKASKLLSVLS